MAPASPSSSDRPPRRHDVAIYAPFASVYYGKHPTPVGGAELQTTLLAGELLKRELRVAHIVYPVGELRPADGPMPTLVQRQSWETSRRFGPASESAAIWRSLREADAAVYVVRGGGGHVAPVAAFCRVHRRRLVFSTSNVLDFDFERADRSRRMSRVYRRGARLADRIVVQTDDQRELAAHAFPGHDPLVVPSFAQPAEESAGDAEYFLWVDRVVEYKQPMRYVELAEGLPEARFRMVIAQTRETPSALVEELRAAAERLPNLELLPARPREQVLEEIGRAVAVVRTSRAEGMPNTFLEGWARGVPALSLEVDPDGRIGRYGLGLTADGSMERFVDQAATLWRDSERRRELGKSARRFVQETHSPDVVGDRWAALVRELIR